MFPVRPVPDNDVKEPQMFLFKDMNDYKPRGKNVDAEYVKMIADKKNSKIAIEGNITAVEFDEVGIIPQMETDALIRQAERACRTGLMVSHITILH